MNIKQPLQTLMSNSLNVGIPLLLRIVHSGRQLATAISLPTESDA
jgi:hypothetical protein